jgi:CheY-like chemotaxis protein
MDKHLTVSIIDDDDIYKFTVIRALKEYKPSQRILLFSDGEEALEYLTENLGKSEALPDVVFLDINMPIMDGFEFMEEYVKIKPRVGKQITIYMISSSVSPEDVNKANSISEISDYIIKPIEPGKLATILQELEH